jgi:hypothetical protein
MPPVLPQYGSLLDSFNLAYPFQSVNRTNYADIRLSDINTNMPLTFFSSSEISETWNPGVPFKATKEKRKLFDSTRLAGVEWEYNSLNDTSRNPIHDHDYFRSLREWSAKWRGGNHYDGSCGHEVVTAPLAGDYIAECLKDLKQAFTAGGAKANRECSVHVHVDAADYDWSDMQRLLTVYGKLEPLLYVLAGHKRVGNRYCSPCGIAYNKAMAEAKDNDKTTAILREAFNAHKWTKLDVERHHKAIRKKDGGRYRGLNIIPWIVGRRDMRKDCTVEFRLHENTLNEDRVINWVHLLVTLVDWCRTATDKDIQALPQSTTKALTIICPNSKAWILQRIRSWKRRGRENSKIDLNGRGVFSFRTVSRTRPVRTRPRSLADTFYENTGEEIF